MFWKTLIQFVFQWISIMAKDQEEIWGEEEIKEIEFALWLRGGWYCQPYYCALNQEGKQTDDNLNISNYLDQYILVGSVIFLQHFPLNPPFNYMILQTPCIGCVLHSNSLKSMCRSGQACGVCFNRMRSSRIISSACFCEWEKWCQRRKHAKLDLLFAWWELCKKHPAVPSGKASKHNVDLQRCFCAEWMC